MEAFINGNMTTELTKIFEAADLPEQQQQLIRETFEEKMKGLETFLAHSKDLVVTDISQKAEMKLAATTRKGIKEIRVNAEKGKDALKAQSIAWNRQVDKVFKHIETVCKEAEAHLMNQEKFEEREEEKRKKALAEERRQFISQQEYSEHVAINEDFENMSASQFEECCASAKQQYDEAVEAEAQAQRDRDAQEKENQRIREENERLRAAQEKKDARIKRFSDAGAIYDGKEFRYIGDETEVAVLAETVLFLDDKAFDFNLKCFADQVNQLVEDEARAFEKAEKIRKEQEERALVERTNKRIEYLTGLGYEEDFGESFNKKSVSSEYVIFMGEVEDASDADFYTKVNSVENAVTQDKQDSAIKIAEEQAEQQRKAASAPDKDKIKSFMKQVTAVPLPLIEDLNIESEFSTFIKDFVETVKDYLETL